MSDKGPSTDSDAADTLIMLFVIVIAGLILWCLAAKWAWSHIF